MSVVDCGSNRRVSKNHIGDVKVSGIECGRSWVKQKSIKESHRWCKGWQDRLECGRSWVNLECGRSWVKQKIINESHRW